MDVKFELRVGWLKLV